MHGRRGKEQFKLSSMQVKGKMWGKKKKTGNSELVRTQSSEWGRKSDSAKPKKHLAGLVMEKLPAVAVDFVKIIIHYPTVYVSTKISWNPVR